MATSSCSRHTPSSIQVIDNRAIDSLIDNINESKWASPSENDPRRRSHLKRPQSTPNPSRYRCASAFQEDADLSRKFQDWLSNKAVAHLQDTADTEMQKTKKMYESVLNTEDTFVKSLEGLVKHKDMLDLRKKEILHKNWTDQVHTPIRRQINDQMNGPCYPELQRRKRELHKEYLEHVNKKGHVFLDTIAPEEYYALSLHPTRPSLLVAETKTLRDPLIGQERERNNEDRTILRCETGSTLSDRALAQLRLPPLPLVPLGRHGTECSTWLEMPMGDIESPVRFASRQRMYPNVNDAQFSFDQWGKTVDRAIVDGELRIQKRRSFTGRRSEPIPECALKSALPLTQDVSVQCQS